MQNYIYYIKTPLGILKIYSDEKYITQINFVSRAGKQSENIPLVMKQCVNQLKQYFSGKRKEFDISVKFKGTEFQKSVWKNLKNIPYGETVSYSFIANKVGGKNFARAVGNANSKNKIPVIIPCHRVIGSDGKLIGYEGGLWRKRWLIMHELKHNT